MDFNTWLSANGFDPETVSAPQKIKLQAQWRAEQNPTPPEEPPAPSPRADSSGFDEKMAAIEEENARIETIHDLTVKACEANMGNRARVEQLKALADAAVADKKTTVTDFKLGLLRLDRGGNGPLIMTSERPAVDDKVIEAAVCKRMNLPGIEKQFDARTLETADKAFKGGLGIQSLLALGARQNGWRGHDLGSAVQSRDFLAAAFNTHGFGDLRAGIAGPSTYSIPNIIANVANKNLWAGFMAVDSTWSRISSRRSVNDFKTATTVGLTGSLQYQKLAPSGEIKHGNIGEIVYTNRADTYAIMLGISRTDLINDDTGALGTAGQRVGRGAALKINDIFWTIFLNNSSFFTSGNANVSTGGGSALGTADGAAINAAEQKFIAQTDADTKPLAIMPAIMLVPPTLRNTALRWMGSQVFTPSGTTGLGATNIFGGRYSVETSPYMENSAYTGNSTAAWYLLANPAELSTIEVVFVNGKDMPTVETAEMDFNLLGIAMRGFIDFGVSLHEYRAGVRSAGS